MTTVTPQRAYATVTGPTATFVAPDGRAEPLTPTGGEDIRQAVVRRAADEARRTGTPVELVTAGDRGQHRLLIDPAGALTPISASSEETAPADATEVPDVSGAAGAPAPESAADADDDIPEELRDGEEVREATSQSDTLRGYRRPTAKSPTRPTFLTATTPTPPRRPGWRGALDQVGIHVPPSAVQRRREEWTGLVSRQWAGCRTLAVANGKGGVGKTMTTAMLAAVYARHGGGNVLAWDNNDTRGTLGWRTEQGLYDTTLRDLLPAAHRLLSAGAGVSEITRFVHHQGVDRYDVLRSNPELLATDQRLGWADFDLLMQVAARFYRLVIFDSGNDESAQRWLRMIDSSYQLVIPTLPSPDSAESAALLLDALRHRDAHSAALAENAVVVVTQPEPSAVLAARRIADGFREHVRAVHVIPFDPALKAGPLRFDSLRPHTRDAWLGVAAVAAKTL